MTTLDEARAIAQRLRYISKYPNVRVEPSDTDTQKEAADTIDALVAEVERLRNALELVVVSIRVGEPEYNIMDTIDIAKAAIAAREALEGMK